VPSPRDRDASRHPLARWLRRRVLQLRASTRCRVFPGVVELVATASPSQAGDSAADETVAASWVYGDQPGDHALRVDVLVRLLTAARTTASTDVSLVHVRPGRHDPDVLDHAWVAAARAAGDIAGVRVARVVAVSRWGWHDVGSAQHRTWVRPRRRAA
jgi:hypothetical protein